jgi:hypothetical protein
MGSSMTFWRAAAARRGLTTRDLGPAIGIEIGGVDLTAPLDEEATAILRGAVVERTLLLIRGQEALTSATPTIMRSSWSATSWRMAARQAPPRSA